MSGDRSADVLHHGPNVALLKRKKLNLAEREHAELRHALQDVVHRVSPSFDLFGVLVPHVRRENRSRSVNPAALIMTYA